MRGLCGKLTLSTNPPLTLLINKIVEIPKPAGEVYSLGGAVGCRPNGSRTSDLGECIGLGQTVGQCGRYKPSAQAPIRGLFYVGCDAGGYGCGTHQAVDSGIRVADTVERYFTLRRAVFRPKSA